MGHIIQSLNQNWFFKLGSEDLTQSSLEKKYYEKVNLPHSVTLTPAISSGGINYQGECVYYKALTFTDAEKNKKIILEFDGAMGVTEVYLNGKYFASHYCSYLPLVIDITDEVKFNEENIIALKLDNSDNGDVPPGTPQSSLDFTYEGGLYREARMHIVDKLYVTHALLADEQAGGGLFVSYEDVTEESATIKIKTHIKNEVKEAQTFKLIHELLDQEGNNVQTLISEHKLNLDEAKHFEQHMEVNAPQLWSMERPYLYKLITSIVEGEICYDQITTTIGIRTFQFTVDKGLLFNGKSVKVPGANYHHTTVYIGNAMPASLLRRDALKLRQAGFKNIRSHYPLTPAFVEACDEYGMTMIVGAPGWQWFKEGIFETYAKDNVRKMVRWLRNHPSILIWEPLLNESYMPEAFKKAVHDIVHEEYPYRDCYTGSDDDVTDILYKNFFDEKEPEEKVVLKKPIWVREYNDRPDDWNNQGCAWRVPRGWGEGPMLKTVERALGQDAQCQRQNYVNMVNDDAICGYGLWPAIEYNRGYHVAPCWGGVLDLYRVPKFAYYFFKSQQDRAESGVILFIANYWSEISANDVVVYSNAERVRLYHNDTFIEEIGPDDVKVQYPPFTFKDVRNRCKKRERSVIKVEALIDGEVVATEVRQSPGIQKQLKLEADFMGIPLKADGSDIVMVYCKVLDEEGNVVPFTADSYPILFTVEGEGEIIGDASIGANPICPEGGIATIMVRSTQKAGPIKVKAELFWKQPIAKGVQGDSLIFESVK